MANVHLFRAHSGPLLFIASWEKGRCGMHFFGVPGFDLRTPIIKEKIENVMMPTFTWIFLWRSQNLAYNVCWTVNDTYVTIKLIEGDTVPFF